MFYPTITLLLWALLFSNPSVNPPMPVAPNSSVTTAPVVLGDSAVYRQLHERLTERRMTLHPEKLYLQLDRTLLRPGESVWFNAYVRNAGDLLPAVGSQVLHIQLLDPRGSVVQEKNILALDGTAAGEFDFPAQLPGGQYKLKAWTNWMLNTGEFFVRDITLQKVVLPNLNLKLEFERKGLGPGDEALARFDALALDNQPLAGRPLRFTVQIGGKEHSAGQVTTDNAGRAWVRFVLPPDLETTDGLLNIQIDHNGQTEAISRPVPIVLNRVDLQFFPEGGDMVAGIPTRLAFKAVNEFGKPADISGRILDGKGRQVALFESYHNGMGAVDFVPQSGEHYTARLNRPVGNEQSFLLPNIYERGYTLRLIERGTKSLRFEIAGSRPGKVFLTGSSRDKLFFFKELDLQQEAVVVEAPVEMLEPGIACFTLFDQNTHEQAERLVFVNKDRGLQIEIKTDKDQYLPREKVRLDIRVRDRFGVPLKGAFSLAVVDEKMLSYADDKQGHLLASLLLEQDVKGKIEEPNFYFDPKEPKADQALDYLLMTQGWRRFQWKAVEPAPFFAVYAAESANIEGQFLSPDNKPWTNRTIRLYPNGPAVRTGNDGRFSFRHIDLSLYTHLQMPNEQYIPLNGYQQNLVVYANGATSHYRSWAYADPEGKTLLSGRLTDAIGEPLIGASIRIERKNQLVGKAVTDINGKYEVLVPADQYDLKFSYTGMSSGYISSFTVHAAQVNRVDVVLNEGQMIREIAIAPPQVVALDDVSEAESLTAEQITNLPTQNINAIVATPAGLAPEADVKIKGARANATTVYVDGVRVNGDKMVEDRADPGGVPADFADRKEMALSEVVIISYNIPMVRKDDMATGATFDADDLVPMSKPAAKSWQPSESRRAAAPYFNPYRQTNFARARQFYAPRYEQGNTAPATGTDFRTTLFWAPSLRTDASGQASVEFYTSDAITNFRATLEGISEQGGAGRAEHRFFVEKPLNMQVKTPPYVISGDLLRLDVALTNKTGHPVTGVLDLAVPAHFALQNQQDNQITIPAGETHVAKLEYRIGRGENTAKKVRILFRVPDTAEESMEVDIPTLDRGFPVRMVMAGQSSQNTWNVRLNDPVEGTLGITLNAYPSPLEDVLKGMERMLNQPGGCFEQVSSNNYPNLLVLDLLRQTGKNNPDVETRANAYLASGYQQLAAYECKNGGFDWWGRDPAHEGLTAYGIMEFVDMKRVYPVDQGLIDRSVKWLLSRRDGQGGWKRREDWHGWQSDGVIGAYIAWAVCEAGMGKKFQPEVNAAYKNAVDSQDPYQMALLANAMALLGDSRADILINQLVKKQHENGSWTGTTHSVVNGGGTSFQVETTALVALALMKKSAHPLALEKAMQFIMSSKNEYGYGSTQSTVLALKALIVYAQGNADQAGDGRLVVQIDGKRVAEQDFSTRTAKRIEIKGLEQFVSGPQARIDVFFEGGKATIPFDIELKYASRQPRNAANCPLEFKTSLDRNSAAIGQTVRLSAQIRNTATTPAASPMVVVGIPAGLSLQPWQLKKLMDEKKCDFYEIWDGYAVFHFERLAPGEQRRLDLDLRADLAGSFEAPASQAFLYYQNEQRVWSKPDRLVIE